MVTQKPAAVQPPRAAVSGHASQWLLALATSTEVCSLGLSATAAGEPWVVQAASGAAASEAVLRLIDQLLVQAGIGRDALGAIAFDSGPGAFTGVRLGCAVAQGLAFALDLPVVPVSSLEAVATQGLPGMQSGTLAWAAVDARMGEVYCAPFLISAEGVAESLAPPQVLSARAAVQWMAVEGTTSHGRIGPLRASEPTPRVLLGNAFERFSELGDWGREQGLPILSGAWPSASAVLSCGYRHWRAGHAVTAALAEPMYVRDKVALDLSEQRQRP